MLFSLLLLILLLCLGLPPSASFIPPSLSRSTPFKTSLNYLQRPSPSLSPEDVVRAQLESFQKGDVYRVMKFASPELRAPWKKNPVALNRLFSPLLNCTHYTLLSGLNINENYKRIRVRVTTSDPILTDSKSTSLFGEASKNKQKDDSEKTYEFNWDLGRQKECLLIEEEFYLEDNGEVDRGIGLAACWMVDSVEPVDVNPEILK
ncbi:hypothetical protein TrLO_g11234 [Triparma laevis f. longispina]|uniref:Uncharacterized protein n=1 Tax=Triparma laevis f. longispina TaxID=1714387 RepID=A0A9W7FJN0_9STRA|nr:hypothetical protein TrLO_g11234 [Triparma laevis f. longispina]